MSSLSSLVVVAVVFYVFWAVFAVKTKKGVNLSVSREIFYAIGVADAIYQRVAGQAVVITSARDSHESRPWSLHNFGQAVDLHIGNLSKAQLVKIKSALDNVLFLQGFDVVLESDHIHIEYDPKIAQGRVFSGEAVAA